MFCKKCGREVNSQAKFCPGCGSVINAEVTVVQENRVNEKTDLPNTYVVANGGNQEELAPVMSVGSYVLLFILSAIPVIGIILIFVFAIDSSNKNKSNYCRAIIVMWILGLVLALFFGGSLLGILL